MANLDSKIDSAMSNAFNHKLPLYFEQLRHKLQFGVPSAGPSVSVVSSNTDLQAIEHLHPPPD